eukprot:ANDGO_08594.mRNA.1 putative helicase CHR10
MHALSSHSLLADDMGLGKTIQILGFLSLLVSEDPDLRFLILCPLSTIPQWVEEITTRMPLLHPLAYVGGQQERSQLQDDFQYKNCVITHYDLFLNDFDVLKRWRWHVCVVDEAHRLKNSESVLYNALKSSEMRIDEFVLATGTPMQNNTRELWSILHFLDPVLFSSLDDFQHLSLEQMRDCLVALSIRRTKSVLAAELPSKKEYLIAVPLSPTQKALYRSILLKFPIDPSVKLATGHLQNITMQLRKCADHPYLFPGVEPEPFECGEHLVSVAGKMMALDAVLREVKMQGSKVLVFSQFTSMLDIIQDYLTMRQWNCERLDGSLRGEDRFGAIASFKRDSSSFVFLISTRAGGLGLNLTAADTVVFYDNDWNPYADLQAEERVYRIGQSKDVKVVRIVSKDTVDELIYKRAAKKKALSREIVRETTIVGELGDAYDSTLMGDMKDFILYGASRLFGANEPSEDADFTQFSATITHTVRDLFSGVLPSALPAQSETLVPESVYVHDGKDYRADETSYKCAISQPASASVSSTRTRTLRNLDEEEIREESPHGHAAKRRRPYQDILASLRLKHNYTSHRLAPDSVQALDEQVLFSDVRLNFVVGDVVHPERLLTMSASAGTQSTFIICHSVDNSGVWGKGGVFDALGSRFPAVPQYYETAYKCRDIKLGDVHLIPMEVSGSLQKFYVALYICMHFNRTQQSRSDVDPLLWSSCLEIVAGSEEVRLLSNPSFHFPRATLTRDHWYSYQNPEILLEQCLELRPG